MDIFLFISEAKQLEILLFSNKLPMGEIVR
jgi:hypothetical protein